MLISTIEAQLSSMRPSERLVANFVMGRPSVVVHMSIADIAERCDVSEPTIMRFCKAIGCMGFMEFKLGLARDLERRTFTMNRANPAVKGPTGFGQAVFTRVIDELANLRGSIPLDRIDEILEWCAVSRSVTILHDGSEALLSAPLVGALLSCRLEANIQSDLQLRGRIDGRVVIALRSAASLADLDEFCTLTLAREGKIVLIGFDAHPNSLAINVGTGKDDVFREHMAYLALLETLRVAIEARLSRTGEFADTASDYLQAQREIAYGDARRRDRQIAQAHIPERVADSVQDHLLSKEQV
jgi:RpiR family transcriptional regulator, carbohydrate utilization regulator